MINKLFDLILIAITLVLLFNKDIEYGEIQVLKIALSVGFCYLVFLANKSKTYPWIPLFIFFALVFLPLFELKLKRETWVLIDTIAIVALLIHFIFSIIYRRHNLEKGSLSEEELKIRKKQRKKVLAREFMSLLICLTIAVLAYAGTYLYNSVLESRVDKLERKIVPELRKIDNLKREYSIKERVREEFFEENNEKYGHGLGYSSSTELWDRLKYLHNSDSIVYKWNYTWNNRLTQALKEMGFNNGRVLNDFVDEYLYTKSELESLKKADSIANSIKPIKEQISSNTYNILSRSEQVDYAFITLAILAMLAFPIRYLIYLIRWSFTTLKEKD